MRQAIIYGLGNLGRALVRTIEATTAFDIAGVVENAPEAAGRSLADLVPSTRFDAPVRATLSDLPAIGPAIVFHGTTSSPKPATEQILTCLDQGHSVVSAAEWLFHPWLRYRAAADAFDAVARAKASHVLGCGINPGFCFETLPLLLSHTVSTVKSLEILRVSNASGVGPSDFNHLGFGLSKDVFHARVEQGSIDGHVGFPESIAALAEGLGLPIDRITDHLEPTLAVRPLQLSHRLVALNEIVGITQTAIGYVGTDPVIRMRLEMFLDPAGYGRTPQEAVKVEGARTFQVGINPAAPPVDGAAAMMVHAARALGCVPPGLVSLLDLPLAGLRTPRRLQSSSQRRSRNGVDISVG